MFSVFVKIVNFFRLRIKNFFFLFYMVIWIELGLGWIFFLFYNCVVIVDKDCLFVSIFGYVLFGVFGNLVER